MESRSRASILGPVSGNSPSDLAQRRFAERGWPGRDGVGRQQILCRSPVGNETQELGDRRLPLGRIDRRDAGAAKRQENRGQSAGDLLQLGQKVHFAPPMASHSVPLGYGVGGAHLAQPVYSFTLLTVNADSHPFMCKYHRPEDEKRMIVVLREEDYDAWLDAPVVRSADFMRPCGPEQLRLLAEAA